MLAGNGFAFWNTIPTFFRNAAASTLGSCITMVMTGQADINITLIHKRCKNCSQICSIKIGVWLSGTINIMVEGYHFPFRIWCAFNCLFHQFAVLCRITVITIQNNV